MPVDMNIPILELAFSNSVETLNSSSVMVLPVEKKQFVCVSLALDKTRTLVMKSSQVLPEYSSVSSSEAYNKAM